MATYRGTTVYILAEIVPENTTIPPKAVFSLIQHTGGWAVMGVNRRGPGRINTH